MSDSMSQVPQSLPLPAGGSTSANQATEITHLTNIDTNTLAKGQATMANSSPVVIASDQSAVAISAASLPLPTGAATAANQSTEITSLASIDGKITATAALADATANPTITKVASFGHGFNGTTWDRLRTAVVAATATLTGFLNALPWAIYNATPTVRTEAQGGPLQADTNGNLLGSLGTKLAGEDLTNDVMKVEAQMTYLNITTATTTTVKSGSGLFNSLTINKQVATGVITIYDNTAASGTKIGTITAGAALLTDPPLQTIYNVKFSTGLTIVTSQAADLTISYR